MDFVIFGLQPWDIDIGSNCKDIALALTKENHRVLYVNAPLSRNHYFFNRNDEKVKKRIELRRTSKLSIEEVSDNLWVYYPDCIVESVNFIRPHSLFAFFNEINNRRLSKSIIKAVEELGFSNFVLFNDNSIYLGYLLKELLNPRKYVYYIRDHLTKMSFWKYHGSKMEPGLISKSDLVVTNSDYYREYASEYNNNSHMIGQGCDYTLLNSKVEVQDLTNIRGPKIGYVGFLTSKRLSIDLLFSLATKKKEWNIILVGPEDDVFKGSRLHMVPNIYFLGQKEPMELGSYINTFDICINPQVVNEITIGNYPRKIDEYLYMGKPTVATYTKAMEFFGKYVSLANSTEEYIKAIENELRNDNPKLRTERMKFAREHTWYNSVSILLEKLENAD